MKLNHLFYNSEVNFKLISKKRIILSILLGLASAVLFYSFFYGLRETERMMFLDFEERPMLLSESDRQLFNLFFAAISVILGNSLAINLLFSRPQRAFSRRNNKRIRILNDNTFLGFNFIHWFAKVWFLFATFSSSFMGSKFITNFLWPSIFLIIVLYLDAWKTLSLVIKNNRLKTIFIHFCAFVLLSFCLSRLNVIDYKSLDEAAYSARPNIDVPHSVFSDEPYERRYYNYLVFKIDFDSHGNIQLYNEQYEPIELTDAYNYVNNMKNELTEAVSYRAATRLRANKSIPIRYVKEFEFELFKYGQYKIIYEVQNDDELTNRFYNNQIKNYISTSLHEAFPRKPNEPPRVPFFDKYKELEFSDTIRVNIGKKIMINGDVVVFEDLVDKFKLHVNSSTIFEYVYTDEASYQNFIDVLSAHKKAIKQLKVRDSKFDYDEMMLQIYRNQFGRDTILNNERDRLREKYPIHIIEKFE
ncbi:MAG: hypothetical protein CMC68_01690 [Flavobacteriaceae bacterium]|nr:hypothetical protein [Flavobacteriaceae bacterium]|tara:strand:- start:3743 stop:5161 length:1419 start_codon:yes stop_codon:yes gene_type:complete